MLFSPSEKLRVCFNHFIPYDLTSCSTPFHVHNHYSFPWFESPVLLLPWDLILLDTSLYENMVQDGFTVLRRVKLSSCMKNLHLPVIRVHCLSLTLMHMHVLSLICRTFIVEILFWRHRISFSPKHNISVSSPFHMISSDGFDIPY